MVVCHPRASTVGTLLRITTNAFRAEPYTTGGGVYFAVTHNGVAGATGGLVEGVGVFDSTPYCLIATYDGATSRGWARNMRTGFAVEYAPLTVGMNAGSGTLDLGGSAVTQGLYAAGYSTKCFAPAVARSLLEQPWDLFESRRIIVPAAAAGGAITIDGAVGNAVAAGTAGSTTQDITIAASVGNAVAAGITGAAAQAVEIAGAVGNAVAAGVTGLAEVGGSISIDGVVGNAVAAGLTGAVTQAVTIAATVGNAVADGVTGSMTADDPAAVIRGGGWAWAAPRKKVRYSYLSPPTREQMAERVRKQREALGILPKPAQKRIAAAVKKEARRPEPSLAPLAPVAVQVAQDTGAPLQAVIDAIRAAFDYQQALSDARVQADIARGIEQQQLAAEQARAEAEAAEQAWQQRLVELRAADDELLRQDEEARQQAVATIRQVQKALMALLAA